MHTVTSVVRPTWQDTIRKARKDLKEAGKGTVGACSSRSEPLGLRNGKTGQD